MDATRTTPIPIERRFPLVLRKAAEDIRGLYEAAKEARWNPDTDVPWSQHALGSIDAATLASARRVWSRRAWVEYSGMTETPALLIRFCLELNRESDPKYFLTVRNTEEAWHVECYHRYAEACGGYVETPPNPAWEPVFNRTLYRDALDADISIDAYVAAHCAFVDSLELELAKAWRARTTEPLAAALLDRCLNDYERHAAFGWAYAGQRAVSGDAGLRERVAGALVRHIEEAEFAGYHCVGLAHQVETRPEIADLRATADAGLGAVSASDEVEIFRTHLAFSRERFAEIGCTLPAIRHPSLGNF